MLTISDAIEHAGVPVQKDKRELFAKGFAEATFYLMDGKPYAVFGDWDYAESWGPDVRSVHPYGPITGGCRISEKEFRALVRDIHGLE